MATPKSGPTKPIILEPDSVEALARIGCTNVEIGAFFKCSTDTLVRNYAESLQRGRDASKASVRRIMWKHAELGNSTALKYLVTNILKEKIEDPFNMLGLAEAEVAAQIAQTTPAETLLKLVKDYDKNKVG